MPVAWLGQPTGSWLAKPFSQWTDIITSPHLTKKKKEAERRAAEGGRLQTHTEQIDEKRHSPSALLVCDTLADNAQSVHSVAGG